MKLHPKVVFRCVVVILETNTTLEITKLKGRVKKLERKNKVRVLNLRRLQRVRTSQRVETYDETVMDDVSNQGRMIAEIDHDVDVVLKDDKEVADEAKEVADVVKDVEESLQDQGRTVESQVEIYKTDLDHANKVLSMQEDETEPAEVQEVVDVVTTAKLITKVVTAASETITAASTNITVVEAQIYAATLTVTPARVTAAPSRRRKRVVIRDLQEESTTSTIIPAETKSKDKGKRILAELNKNIDWDEAIDHVKKKAKEDPAMDYFKGMSCDDIRPIFEAKFNSNVAFLLKIKEQIEEDKNRALKRLHETLAERAAKRQKLDEEVEELKIHLQIVPNEDDDVYTEATPLARKVLVVDYHIIKLNNKPYYKIIRADDTPPIVCQRMEAIGIMWCAYHNIYIHPADFISREEVPTHKMHSRPDAECSKVKGWKLLESCGVHIITFTSTQLILLVERKYPLTRFTLDQMLNVVRLEVEEESEVSLELLRFIRQQHQEGQLE
nr:hypothetical protein [Tanacetum cinerariifolium]